MRTNDRVTNLGLALVVSIVLGGCEFLADAIDDATGDEELAEDLTGVDKGHDGPAPVPGAAPGAPIPGGSGGPVRVEADFNGDGISDVLAGAPASSVAGQAGRAYVFFGGAGLVTEGAAAADVILTGENGADGFGVAVAAGDVDGDGIADVLVGADGYDGVGSNAGRAYVFLGGPGLASRGAGTADVILTGEAGQDRFGGPIATADVNGDGVADALVAGIQHDAAGDNSGRVYVFFGGAGLANRGAAAADVILTGEAMFDYFGYSLAASDVNGDGTADLLIGAYGNSSGGFSTGRAYVFFGGPGLVSQGALTADVILTGEAGGSRLFGTSVAGGDVNGDGTADVLVGARENHAGGIDAGRAYVFFGGAGLVSRVAAAADVLLTGEAAGDRFGEFVGAGDVNGDGTADVLAGAPFHDTAAMDAGRAYVFFGGPGLSSRGAAAADVRVDGEAMSDLFGFGISAWDVAGDGTLDLVVPARSSDAAGLNSGRLYVFFGGAGLVSQGAAAADVILTGEGAGHGFGYSVAALEPTGGAPWPARARSAILVDPPHASLVSSVPDARVAPGSPRLDRARRGRRPLLASERPEPTRPDRRDPGRTGG